MFTVTLAKSGINFQYNPTISLLSQIESLGFNPEYQCRSGYCGGCRARLISGKISYPQQPLALIHPDEILLCFCRVESDITLDI